MPRSVKSIPVSNADLRGYLEDNSSYCLPGIVKTPDRAYVTLPLLERETIWAYYDHAIKIGVARPHPFLPGLAPREINEILTELKQGMI